MPVGLSPQSAVEVNQQVGLLMRTFAATRGNVHQQNAWLVATDLKVPPYDFAPEEETLIKSAMGDLDTTLQAVNMTFISRLIGLPS